MRKIFSIGVGCIGLTIASTLIFGQTDYILEQGIRFIPPYGGDVYTHYEAGEANSIVIQSWALPPVLKPGQQCEVTVKFKVWTNHSPVFYVNYFGDWQPNVELAQSSLYGGIPSADEVFTDTFEFTAPSTPGWYRMRFMWRGNFSATPSFYGGTSSDVPNAITTKFSDIETIDGQSGYLRTAWKVVKASGTDWELPTLGYTKKRTRVVVRVEQREPFKVRIKAERMVYSDEWVPYGNDESVESELMEEINARL